MRSFFLAALVLSGCDHDRVKPGPVEPVKTVPTEPRWRSIDANILKPRCLKCHQPPQSKGGVDLSSLSTLLASPGTLFSPLVAQVPESSGLYLKVADGSMPPGKTKLSAADKAAVAEWIRRGALDD